MYSTKKNVLQLISLMREFGIKKVIICPGSRNAPLAKTFTACKDFDCYSVTDERSAGFQVIGMIESASVAIVEKTAVAVCCTSGSALLNLAPAVAEAYYKRYPLVIVSADRPQAWINQKDGQTIVQPDVFHNFIDKSVTLPEINTEDDEWYCNRLINEAFLHLTNCAFKGPVHINVPISEPLFDFSQTKLPIVRKISANINETINKWGDSHKPLILVGQMLPNKDLEDSLEILSKEKHCVVLAEVLSNVSCAISNLDEMELTKEMAPDFLVTIGGHVFSKKIKQFLRNNPPQTHWHISENGEVADTYKCLTDVLACSDIDSLLISLSEIGTKTDGKFQKLWQTASEKVSVPDVDTLEKYAVRELLKQIPENSNLHLANSSSLRLAQRYAGLLGKANVFCNRGTNGIEGSLSTAVGHSNMNAGKGIPEFLIIGDLSFFYDMNALISLDKSAALHILLLNNNGGKIFENLLPMDEDAAKYVAGKGANVNAEGWVKSLGINYISAKNTSQIDSAMKDFLSVKGNVVLEIFSK